MEIILDIKISIQSLQTQQILLVILSVALANFVAGSIMGPRTDQAKARGFLGYSSKRTGDLLLT